MASIEELSTTTLQLLILTTREDLKEYEISKTYLDQKQETAFLWETEDVSDIDLIRVNHE